MLSSRTLRLTVGAFAGVLVLLGLWSAWQVYQVNRDLNDAAGHARSLQQAAESGDQKVLDREVRALRQASADAVDRTSGVTWSVLSALPFVGDDAEGVAITSEVLKLLARDGVEPLVDVAARLDDLLPADGAVDLSVIEDLAGPVAEADEAFAAADDRLADLDSSGYVDRLGRQVSEFRTQVDRGARAMHSANIATRVLPAMLGAEGTRGYLLVFQNNAEIRGTGGLAGAVSYVESDAGRLSLRRHVSGASFGETPEPVLPLTPAESKLYGDAFGRYFLNAGMTPDVPRAADLMKARWEQQYPRQSVSGVVMIDAVALGYLLEVAGPVTVDGVRLTGDNVVDELLHQSYIRLPDPAEQDLFFAEVAAKAFDKFTSGAGEPEQLLRAMTRAADERRLLVHSFDAAEQRTLTGTAIAGEFETSPDVREPQIGVTINDTTGSKMSYFLRYDVEGKATSCVDGVQTYAMKAHIRSVAPADAAELPSYITGGGKFGVEPGHELITLRIFGPVGGTIGELTWNSAPMDLIRVDQQGRPVGMTYIDLSPGQVVDLTWTLSSGAEQAGDGKLMVTPTIEDVGYGDVMPTACR